MPILEVTHLNKSYGSKSLLILNDLSFKVEKNTIVGIFGRNGTGKSTLFKILFGALKYDSGTFLLENQVFLPSTNIRRQQIAFLPQDSFLPSHLRVRELIPLFHENLEIQSRIFHEFRIPEIDDRRVGDLSEGARKYVAFLLTIHLPHTIVLLDEPFSMVEPIFKDHIKRIISSFSAVKTIILSDHYYEDVLSITESNFVMKDGKLLPVLTQEDLVRQGYLGENK